MLTQQTDVLICGAGPVGLLVALGLEQQGINTILVEKRERELQKVYGRAGGLYPRTLELLEQLDVLGDLEQQGFVARANANFNNGNRKVGRGWQTIFDGLSNTQCDFMLNIRQKFSEDVFISKYCQRGKKIEYGWQLVDLELQGSSSDACNITAHLQHSTTKEEKVIRCKYLVGADGGHSRVREAAGVKMLQASTQHEWVRIDGKMETDMPDANLGSSSIETAKHGNVLWVKLDKDAYRIGYALTPELRAKYPQGLTQEQAVEEAIESLKPFNLTIPRVDWWTSYSVIQGVAATMQKDSFVLLAGDAAHVHSSGFAQGMNTGIHDATNLIWKLAGTIKGWYNPFVLTSYDSERRPIAHKLIEMDKSASDAISGNIPAQYRELVEKGANADDIVTKIYSENIAFVSGLGISYSLSLINHEPLSGTVMAGHRAPDALLKQPGRRITIRLFDVTRAYGRWNIIVFGGYHTVTQSKLITLRDQLLADEDSLANRYSSVLKLSTIIAGSTSSAWEVFDGPGMGKLYFDPEGVAHCLYGVSLNSGAIVVIRPDGIMGFATALNEADKLGEYFKGFCL